jgi:prepilin-type N-terminal cleavage/methylation domain-containing protein
MSRRAFTLVELLVVISIIGLLSTIAVVSLGSARMNARNTQRKANLVQISKALDLYYADNSSYPSTGGLNQWRGACSAFGPYPDSGAGAWIPNFQNYMAQLPHDPMTNKAVNLTAGCQASGGLSCYIYTSDGIDYKIIAHCLGEGPLAGIGADLMADPGAAGGRLQQSYAVYSPGARAW